ncbi:phage late control D family protein [Chengkuizengella axinellae]|uniref:Late control protein n=1 Tax=Chengkuizengella axinellae TaxID=3064388 RepID=A0ABT9J884_9BACL|nr:late control protein [Chengkuizengella sp. 2205SS18-9]MDP5277139.1 late control protein [Chengkuizengella sp. 2205SS18-9]
MEPRQTKINIIYEGKNITQDIQENMLSFNFIDNGTGLADDLQLQLQDREGLWVSSWMPQKGDRIKAEIVVLNRKYEGTEEKLNCGTFEVDTVNVSGKPDIVIIKATSIPANSSIRRELKTKAWENVNLTQIGRDIAGTAGLKQVLELDFDPLYDRVNQNQQSDLSFLQQTSQKYGITTKVTDQKLVLFDEYRLEQTNPIKTLTRGDQYILSYSFDSTLIDASYSACEVSYYDTRVRKTYLATYKPPNAPNGPVLKLNERVSSNNEAYRLAQKSLREKNKQAVKGKISLMGDVNLQQGLTINVNGMGDFNGKYLIETAKHVVKDGYSTSITIRKVLGY